MNWKAICALLVFLCLQMPALAAWDLKSLQKSEKLSDFEVSHIYSDSEGHIVAAKFVHLPSGAPVFLLQLETVPQVITWVDSPTDSNRGLAHALEHLLTGKGVKGRYLNLLKGMRLSGGGEATFWDCGYYGLSSESGLASFFEQFHALLDALYRPDFTDMEAEREFHRFAVADDGGGKKTLIETGTVYNEKLSNQYRYDYVFELNKRVFGDKNPFAFNSGGAPADMRGVTPEEIREFHDTYYRIGPSTGFIFSFSPRENVPSLLRRISQEFQHFSKSQAAPKQPKDGEAKYPFHPSSNLEPGIYPFPAPSDTAPGFVHFAWPPEKGNGIVDLKMITLLAHALAGGEGSLLHKAVVASENRTIDFGATGVDSELFVENSPWFPVVIVEVSGIPGNRIAVGTLEQLRAVVLSKIKEVSEFPDHSEALKQFNQSVASYARSLRRSDKVWMKNPPGFGSYPPNTSWKRHFAELETDSAFVRPLTEDRAWEDIDQQLAAGKNVWRNLISKFHLLNSPYVTATTPSPALLEDTDKKKRERVMAKIQGLMEQYRTSDGQAALARFVQEESVKTKIIDEIDARVPHPGFTDHPPMVPDEDVRSSQFELEGVPVIASIFTQPPTIDIGLSFDLRRLPRRYYKYLPLLPRTLDSLGLKNAEMVLSYPQLLAKIQNDIYAFSASYEANAVSQRADFTIRSSATNVREFRSALDLIQQLMNFNYLDLSNADHLRDIVARNISTDDLFPKQDASSSNAGYSFRYQKDQLYLALNSRFTVAHLNNRLKWLLHPAVNQQDLQQLRISAREFLSLISAIPAKDVGERLNGLRVTGLQKELVEYWRSNSSAFSEPELVEGLRTIAAEVLADLETGPAKTIEDLRALQTFLFNRGALRIDLTLSQPDLEKIRGDLASFVKSIPLRSSEKHGDLQDEDGSFSPLTAKLEKRYHMSLEHAPWYVGFVNPNRTGGDVIFYAAFPGYNQLDRQSLMEVLASKIFQGTGPQTFQMRTLTRGLAYRSSLFSDSAVKRIWYYADRSPDIGSLLDFLNETAARVEEFKDRSLLDYAFSNTFTFSRATSSFSERGKASAQDIRDGNGPETIRRFSQAMLQLRNDPNLLSELTHTGLAAICGVLISDACKDQHETENSLFFFVGSHQSLADTEKRVPIPKLLKLYPSDYWIDFSDNLKAPTTAAK